MNLQRLPEELMLQILEDVEHEIPVRLDEPQCPYYWCMSSSVLSPAWRKRRRKQRLAWSQSVPPLCQINSYFRQFMRRRLKAFDTPPTLRSFDSTRSSHTRSAALSANAFFHHKSLIIFLEDRIPYGTWRLIGSKSHIWESLTFDFSLGTSYVAPGIHKLHMPTLPNLRSFTLRSTGTQHWVDHQVLRNLVKSSPKLIHLTIFHLQGTSPVANSEPKPICSLKSLSIRRFRDCNQDTVGYLISNSHQSLRALTIVLDGAEWWTDLSLRYYRGIRATELQAALAPCVELRTLRFADRTARSVDYNNLHLRELDPEFGPLGYILDDMVNNLRRLKKLHIWGAIFSMKLFDNLQISGCRLKVLSIQGYPKFPVLDFLEHLRENPALGRLRLLQLGANMIHPEHARGLSFLCDEWNIEFRTLV
ncbi:hypothetical protein O181_103671 [Austropuccinia psidii MF-1]|uniref:F-box domain-containing protein n=1 Tax=Austropuccinia psidii MF-1 TaxID=1389203 RepID=A0A9Q3JKW3_9BASI|nr:hypothetical protein [Austropuccinia psidii MF-1]